MTNTYLCISLLFIFLPILSFPTLNQSPINPKQNKTQQLKVALYINFACIGGSDITNNDKNNVESQCKGVVIVCLPNVCSNDSYNSKESKERIEANALIEQVVPIRIAAVHVCLPNVLKFKLLASVYGMISKASISRTKIHLGNPIEIRYQLQQYGKLLVYV